jgi:hypothetical protein
MTAMSRRSTIVPLPTSRDTSAVFTMRSPIRVADLALRREPAPRRILDIGSGQAVTALK